MRSRPTIAGSPVLIGAITVLVTIVAVMLAYNANSGLPFVPTFRLEAETANAEQLVEGAEVRIGGSRVGIVTHIRAIPREDGPPVARLQLELDDSVRPLPADSTLIIRPRSSLALKYVEITRGGSAQGLRNGARLPVTQASPEPVEMDQVLNTFDGPTRDGARASLDGLGTGFAARGDELNTAIGRLRPLIADLEPVMSNLADPQTGLGRLIRSLAATAGEVAPVAAEQAELFVALDTTFGALAEVARPYFQDFISESPPTLDAGIEGFPVQRPRLRNARALLRELRPGVATLPTTGPVLADAFEAGSRTLPGAPALNRRIAGLGERVAEYSETPLVRLGIDRVAQTFEILRPTAAFLAPVQTTCNYVTLALRNVSDLMSEEGETGTFQRFIQVVIPPGPDSEAGPSDAAASGPQAENFLHANPYPNTASPGQTRECEAGNETYRSGAQVIGNVPGNQGAFSEKTARSGR